MKPVPASAPTIFNASVEVRPKSVESMTPFPSESMIGARVTVLALPVVVIAAIVELELPEVLKLNCVPAGHDWLKVTLNRFDTEVFKSLSETSSISDPS